MRKRDRRDYEFDSVASGRGTWAGDFFTTDGIKPSGLHRSLELACLHQAPNLSMENLFLGELTEKIVGPDLIVNESVIVDAKVVDDFAYAHISQMFGYPTITGLRLALLLNFRNPTLQWRRVIL